MSPRRGMEGERGSQMYRKQFRRERQDKRWKEMMNFMKRSEKQGGKEG